MAESIDEAEAALERRRIAVGPTMRKLEDAVKGRVIICGADCVAWVATSGFQMSLAELRLVQAAFDHPHNVGAEAMAANVTTFSRVPPLLDLCCRAVAFSSLQVDASMFSEEEIFDKIRVLRETGGWRDDTADLSVFQTGIAVEMRKFRVLQIMNDVPDPQLVAWSRDRQAAFLAVRGLGFTLGALVETDRESPAHTKARSSMVALGGALDDLNRVLIRT